MTRGDRIVVLVVVALAVGAWPIAGLASGAASGGTVAVVTGPGVTYRLPLDAARRLEVRGIEGPVTVEIAGGSVRVVEAPCRDHLCVRRGAVDAAGEAVVCAPNGVTVRITGRSDAPDAVIR